MIEQETDKFLLEILSPEFLLEFHNSKAGYGFSLVLRLSMPNLLQARCWCLRTLNQPHSVYSWSWRAQPALLTSLQ